ncbi:MAG TPA: hypothetical protein PKK15_25400 [Kouleothrix sp.]|mgnify:CR=1 FL=1|uniref:hypothetical protein n=1 Tax=Kouleothrix sp. TaxID=2779161 RepID=UPI002C485946|nr:hypothetical protein [Kouleothrix sp.]
MGKRIPAPPDPVASAREVARAEVERRWPELAGVEPTVTLRARHMPAPAELERVGAVPLATAAGAEYTFTFAGHTHTPDGYTLPRIARVTIDAQRRVVKATTSK